MAENVADISTRIRSALLVSDPNLDTSVGTPVRKIVDAVAESISEVGVEQYLLNYQYDIDSKTGTDLDNFVSVFGFQRYAAKRASGVITFTRSGTATTDIFIPSGTQIATSTTPIVIAQTLVPASLPLVQTDIDIPCQTIIQGALANVPAFAFSIQATPINGIAAVVNGLAFTGGADSETDDALKLRFKRTVFRSIAGTEDMFLAVALEDVDVSRANIVGASKTYREQIALTGSPASGVSSATDVKKAYPDSSFFGTDIDGNALFTRDVDYDFDDTAVPPEVTAINTGLIPAGIYDLQYDYVSAASRNDVDGGVTNKIDVWLDGTRAVDVTENVVFDSGLTFDGSPYDATQFEHSDGTIATADNIFMPLSFGPIVTFPAHLTIGLETYDEGVDYFVVHQKSPFGYAPKSLFGIEWLSVTNGQSQALPADATQVLLEYTYNDVPTACEVAIRQWRLVTTDVWAHQAKLIRLNLNIAVIYTNNAGISAAQDEVEANLATFIQSVGFDQALQVSDLIRVIGNTVGIDAVRFLTHADDATHYAIQHVADDGTTVLHTYDNGGSPARAIDIVFGDDEVPVFNAVRFVRKAQNSFGAL